MKKILATTDFSDNSIAGLHFAIQLTLQNNYELTFFHVYHTLTPNAWNAVRMEEYEQEQALINQENLNDYINHIYNKLNVNTANYTCIINRSVSVDTAIKTYAEENNFDFICISTRGAGFLKRLLGTNTSTLINTSNVPIIAVPHHYLAVDVTSVLYVSDLLHYKKEIAKVIHFAQPLKATITLLHLNSVLESTTNINTIDEALKEIDNYHINCKLTPRNPDTALIQDIEEAVKVIQPSILIMFTEQHRSWFEKILISSKSAEYSFDAKVPLLVFQKT